jgi:hypothetical protein
MMQKKAMEDAKTKLDAQVQDKLHALEIRNSNAAQELQKMQDMDVLPKYLAILLLFYYFLLL